MLNLAGKDGQPCYWNYSCNVSVCSSQNNVLPCAEPVASRRIQQKRDTRTDHFCVVLLLCSCWSGQPCDHGTACESPKSCPSPIPDTHVNKYQTAECRQQSVLMITQAAKMIDKITIPKGEIAWRRDSSLLQPGALTSSEIRPCYLSSWSVIAQWGF